MNSTFHYVRSAAGGLAASAREPAGFIRRCVLWALLLALGLATRLVALAMIAPLAIQMMSAMHADQFYLLMLFALLAIHGGGKWSLDRLLEIQLKKIFPQLDGKPAFAFDGLPRVVIVGAGFGGMSCAAALRNARANVTLIDRHNYHLFQPLLYQVATAALSPGDIAMPIRGLFREHFNTRVLARRSDRDRYQKPGSADWRQARRLRLSGAGDRRDAQLLWPRRVGGRSTRPETSRGCARRAPASARCFRESRGH